MPKRVSANSRIIAGSPPNIRAGFGIVERRYMQARRDLACTEQATERWGPRRKEGRAQPIWFDSDRDDATDRVYSASLFSDDRCPHARSFQALVRRSKYSACASSISLR